MVQLSNAPFNVYNQPMFQGYLTTRAASQRSGLSQDHIRRLLEQGTLEGVKVGRDWFLLVSSLEHYLAHRPRPGRKPRKEQPT